MKTKLATLLLVGLSLLLGLTACARNISVQDFDIKRVMPSGLRDVNGAVGLYFNNTNGTVSVTSASGTLYHKGGILGTFSVNPFTIPGKCTAWVEVGGSVHLDDSVGLVTILRLVGDFDVNDFSADFDVRMKSGPFGYTIRKRNVPLSQYVGKGK